MRTLTISETWRDLDKLLDDVADSHEPIWITGKNGSVVLIAEEDWRAVQETLYLLSVPEMRDSIREGLETPIAECGKDLGW